MNNIYNIKQTLSHVKNSLGKVLSVAVLACLFSGTANAAYYVRYCITNNNNNFKSGDYKWSSSIEPVDNVCSWTFDCRLHANYFYFADAEDINNIISLTQNPIDNTGGLLYWAALQDYDNKKGVCVNIKAAGPLKITYNVSTNEVTIEKASAGTSSEPTVRAGVAPVITSEGVTVNAYLAKKGCYNGTDDKVTIITANWEGPNSTSGSVYITGTDLALGSHNINIPLSALTENGTYCVKFTATNQTGVSEASDVLCFENSVECEAPVITAQPSSSVVKYCIGADANELSVTATAPITYQWYSNTTASTSAGTLIAGATSSSYTPSTAEAGTLYYYCVVTGCNAQTATSEVSGAVTVEATPSLASVDGPTVLCATAGNTATYTTQSVTGATYTWKLSSNLTGSSESNSITVTTTGDAGAANVEVYASSSAGCKSEVVRADIILESGSSIDAGKISGNTEVCSGSTVTYNNSSPNGTVFNWSVPDGWTIASGQGTNQIKVNVGTSSGYVGVSVSNSCGGDVPAPNYAVTVLRTPATPESITGDATVCKNVEYTYSTPDNGAEEYIWKLPAGWSASCTADKTTIKAVPGPNAVSGNIKVKAKSDCGESEYYSMAVTVNGATLEISGVGAKSASATYPWQPMVLTTIPDNVEVDWSYTYSTTLSETSTVFVANGNSATLKSGAPVSDTEHYTVTATTRSADAGCQTSASYDVYISSDIAEVCAK